MSALFQQPYPERKKGKDDKYERNQRHDPPPLTRPPNRNSTNRRTENKLELREENLRDSPDRVSEDARVKCLTETADDAVTVVVVVGQRVPDQPPLDRADGHDEQTRVEGCQAAATRRIAGVCEADGGNDEPAEDGADEDEERVRFGAGGPVCQDGHDVTLLYCSNAKCRERYCSRQTLRMHLLYIKRLISRRCEISCFDLLGTVRASCIFGRKVE